MFGEISGEGFFLVIVVRGRTVHKETWRERMSRSSRRQKTFPRDLPTRRTKLIAS